MPSLALVVTLLLELEVVMRLLSWRDEYRYELGVLKASANLSAFNFAGSARQGQSDHTSYKCNNILCGSTAYHLRA